MKTILFLIVCGVGYASALPSCTQEEYYNCLAMYSPTDSKGDPFISEARLDEYCETFVKSTECAVNLINRCPNAPFTKYSDMIGEQNRVLSIFCDKANPIRKKMLDNSACLSEVKKNFQTECDNIEMMEHGDADVCRKMKRVFQCTEEKVREHCGEDAREAFVVAQNIDFQLKIADCL